RYMCGLNSAIMRPADGAKRPAGTREALPGTCCGTVVPRFLHWPSEPGWCKSRVSVDSKILPRWGAAALRPYKD
ncbi:MAG: hypothetical protein WAM58_09030, partial [Candidatus Acidiferrum sp.]